MSTIKGASAVRTIQKKLHKMMKDFIESKSMVNFLGSLPESPELEIFLNYHTIIDSYDDDIAAYQSDVHHAFKFVAKMRGKRQDAMDLQAEFDELFEVTFPDESAEVPEAPSSSTKRPRESEDDSKAKKRSAVEHDNQKCLLTDLKDIVNATAKDPAAELFLYPVDKSLYPEYYQFIKHPMDITTWKKKFNVFHSVDDGLKALRLIWNNCLQFNIEGSEIAQQAIDMGNHVESLIQERLGKSFVDFSWNSHAKESKAKTPKKATMVEEKSIKTAEKAVVKAEKSDKTEKRPKSSSKKSGNEFASITVASMRDILKVVCNSEFAVPFMEPVTEDVAPGYFSIIDTPMDLNSIKKKLRSGLYDDRAQNFVEDMRLIWENCNTYNDPESDISNWANSLAEVFETQLAKVTVLAEVPVVEPTPKKVKEVKEEVVTLSAEKVAGNKRKSEEVRSTEAPAVRERPLVDKSLLSFSTVETLLNKMRSFKFVDPFLLPVNVKAAPGYLDIISTPMDLSTVEKKLRKGAYNQTLIGAIEDIRIIWQNCMAYNSPDSEISHWASECDVFFEAELQRVLQAEKEKALAKAKAEKEAKEAQAKLEEEKRIADFRAQEEERERRVREKAAAAKKLEGAAPDAVLKVEEAEEDAEEDDEEEEKDEEGKVKSGKKLRAKIPFRERKFRSVLRNIMLHPLADPFLRPSTDPNYLRVVTKPIDLTQIRERLPSYLPEPLELLADLKLVFDNYLAFTHPDSDLHKSTMVLRDYAVDMFYQKFLFLLPLISDEDNVCIQNTRARMTLDNNGGALETQLAIDSGAVRTQPAVHEPPVLKGNQAKLPPMRATVDTAKPKTEEFPPVLPPGYDDSKVCEEVVQLLTKDTNNNSKYVRAYCQKKASELLKETKLPFNAIPSLYEVTKFGEMKLNKSTRYATTLLPAGYTVARSLRICLVPIDSTQLDAMQKIPFVPVNVKSTILVDEITETLKYQVMLDNGLVIHEARSALSAWSGLIGKELSTFHVLGSKLKRCRAVFNRLSASPDSVAFLESIPADSPDAANYYRIITSPMWLREVHTRLVEGVYDNEFDFAWDMRLIFRNCKQYNAKKSPLYNAAERLMKLFDHLFVHWVLNVRDKSVDDLAKGEWDQWYYLKYFDSNPNEHFCVLTKQAAKEHELLQCAWCEDQYLPAELNVPGLKAGLKTWGCARCKRALELANNDMAGEPFVAELADNPYNTTEFEGNFFVPAPDVGESWYQALRRNKAKLKNLFLSPLGYEVYSPEDVPAQIEFETNIDRDLYTARAKEYKEQTSVAEQGKKGKSAVSARRRKGGRAQKRSAPVVTEEGEEAEEEEGETQVVQNPIDSKFLEEEGRIVYGKLGNFTIPEGFKLAWYTCVDEDAVLEKIRNGEDPTAAIETRAEMLSTNIPDSGYYGIEVPIIRSRLEGLELTSTLQCYRFLHAATARLELLEEYKKKVTESFTLDVAEKNLMDVLIHERWVWEKQRVMPKKPNDLTILPAASSSAMDVDTDFARENSLGFKSLGPKQFPSEGIDVLLTIWDFLDRYQSSSNYLYYSFSELMSSLNPPNSILPSPGQVIYDELSCILTEHLLMETRRRAGLSIDSSEWQDALLVHPVNILTWPKVAEKALLLLAMPFIAKEFKEVLHSAIEGEALVYLKVFALLMNHPYIDDFLDVSMDDAVLTEASEKLANIRTIIHLALIGAAELAVDNSSFSSNVLEIFDFVVQQHANADIAKKAASILTWLKSLFHRIGFVSEAPEVTAADSSVPMANADRSWGSFTMSFADPVQYDIVTPVSFNTMSAFDFKMKSIASLERALSLLSCADPEGWCTQDRIAVYWCLVDFCMSSFAHTSYLKAAKSALARTTEIPSNEIPAFIAEVNLKPVSNLPKKTKCYFTGIPTSVVSDASLWAVVPPEFLHLPAGAVVAEDEVEEPAANKPEAVVESDSSQPVIAASSGYMKRTRHQSKDDHPTHSGSRSDAVFALKTALTRVMNCRQAALLEKKSTESVIDTIIPYFSSNFDVSADWTNSMFCRAQPIGYDKVGNAYWIFDVQKSMCMFDYNAAGRALDIDASTKEPCIFLLTTRGHWMYHNGKDLDRLVANLSTSIPCEKSLKYRLIERYLQVKRSIDSNVLKVKTSQQMWIDRKINVNKWLSETTLYTGSNEAHRSRQLEVFLARCTELRMNVYSSKMFYDDHEEQYPSQRAERESFLRKQRMMKDLKVDQFFDIHPTHGWLHVNSLTRLRQLSASTTATRIHGDPTICHLITQNLTKCSRFLRKCSAPATEASTTGGAAALPTSSHDANKAVSTSSITAAAAGDDAMDVAMVPATTVAASSSSGMPNGDEMEVDNNDFDMDLMGIPGEKRKLTKEELDAIFAGRSNSALRPVEQLHPITSEVLRIYPSGKEASLFMGISQGGISQCINEIKTEFHGFKWRAYLGPDINFGMIEPLQTPLHVLKEIMNVKGKIPDGDPLMLVGQGNTDRLKAVLNSYSTDGKVYLALYKSEMSIPHAVEEAQQYLLNKVQTLPKPAVTIPTVIPATKDQNFAFPGAPAFSKPQPPIVTSTITAPAKLIKLKAELLNMMYAFPEKALRWPDLDEQSEALIKEAGDAAMRTVHASSERYGNLSQTDLERQADRASRKARRRLRRKLALDGFLLCVQKATTPFDLMQQVLLLENAIPKVITFEFNEDALSNVANTVADVALRIFVLDRVVAYNELYGIENAASLTPFKLRTQFACRCYANPQCVRFMGHIGKCISAAGSQSRFPDHFFLAPPEDSFSQHASSEYGLSFPRPATAAPTDLSRRPTPAPMPPRPAREEPLPTLAMFADKVHLDIENITPYVPNQMEITESTWV